MSAPKRPAWSQITTLKIDPEEVYELFEELAKIGESGAEYDYLTAVMLILIRRYPRNRRRAFCITERVICLKAMMDDQRWSGWMIQPADAPYVWIETSICAAIARSPLHFENDAYRFHSDEFFAIALLERDREQKSELQ